MSTSNPRVNITLEPKTAGILNTLAKHEHKSVSAIAKELILEALDRREDIVLSSIATARDTNNQKRITHSDDIWE